ncbi:acyloxyacyl hydrolase [Pseudoalteromonas sp. BDTF-M6]|uniref:acyloxyacyl hydrolase n=1 Tax=Pseudoalteromonas sp. BDTF-M6 TaxID=2796132 RepID=UPI001BB04FE1|nr:acyloxyacyl hydrolase [Pseudoalteromonas sp. BDTF-M6]MBS3797889.1 acyloxyacyl hydrolase [Pseudoalteromonas sp. BDTF-M6]
MKSLILVTLTGALSLVPLAAAQAQEAPRQGYTLHYIQGEGDVQGIKLGYQYYLSDYLPERFNNVEMFFESSVNFWRYGDNNDYDHNFVVALTPVFQYPITQYRGHPLLFEFGIGFSLLDDTQFAGKDVSTHYQFEDRIGVVYKLGNAEFGLRYLHYSNAGFESPNPGLDFISLSYSRSF